MFLKITVDLFFDKKRYLKKTFLTMKLIAIFLFAACLQVGARGYSQEITLSQKNVSLKRVFKEIESQSGYHFFYRDKLIREAGNVSVNVSVASVEEALSETLKGLPLTFTVLDKIIVIKAKKPVSIAIPATVTLSSAPENIINGTVKDAQGNPLSGVSVIVKGTKKGTSTDTHGNFTIEVNAGEVLEFTIVGYQKKSATVGQDNNITVVLEIEAVTNNEVVVVGYGTAKRATLTGAISAINGKEILQSPATNVSNSLVGRLAGLVAVQPSGEPGNDASTIRIRGINTFGNNDVLIVVDGIPGRSLDRIDPNSIESVTILKDASAAIYGAQAANGVILITTKQGKIGKPQITLSLNSGYAQPTAIPKMADAATYVTMLNEISAYNGTSEIYTKDDIQKYKDGSDPWGHPNTDWFKSVLKPRSEQYAANVSLSGGSEFARYFVSVGYKHQDGDYYHSGTFYNQPDFRSNLNFKINKYINFGFSLAGRQEDRNFQITSANSIFQFLMRGKPNLPAYWPNGLPGPDIENGQNPVVTSTDIPGYDKNKYYAINSNFKLNIDIPWIKGLSLTGNAAIDKGFRFEKVWQIPWYLYSWDGTSYDANNIPVLIKGKKGSDAPQLTEVFSGDQQIVLNALINYERIIAVNHTIKVMVGSEKSTGNGDNFDAFRKNFTSGAIDQLFAGGSAEMNNSGSAYTSARLNYFGRVNYSYKEKYLAEFVWRDDGSYIFPEAHRFGFFPGVSAGWRISEENFWKKNIKFIDNLKIRASWGQTGNDRVAEWQYLSTYAFGNFLGFAYTPFVTNGNVENPTLYETRIPNPIATWELATQKDIGFDAQLLNNKLSIEFDYFDYLRSKILAQRNASVPSSTGLTLPLENIGRVSNKGYDFTIGYKDHAGAFNYQISVNGSYAHNKILFWDETPGSPDYQKSTGKSIGGNLYYQAIGIFKDQAAIDKYPHWIGARPGDIIFKDVNGDGFITSDDEVRNDRSNIPRFVGGITVNLQYKGFDLSILLQGATGAVSYLTMQSGTAGNFLESFAKSRWTTTNTDASSPRTFDGSEYWLQSNTFFLKNTDYLRLKTFQLGYSISPKIIQSSGIQNMRFYLSGFNLFTYSPAYKDFDPEAAAGGGFATGQGYPLQRVITAGLTLTF